MSDVPKESGVGNGDVSDDSSLRSERLVVDEEFGIEQVPGEEVDCAPVSPVFQHIAGSVAGAWDDPVSREEFLEDEVLSLRAQVDRRNAVFEAVMGGTQSSSETFWRRNFELLVEAWDDRVSGGAVKVSTDCFSTDRRFLELVMMANISSAAMDELVAGLRDGSFQVPEATLGFAVTASDAGASGSTASSAADGDTPGPSHGRPADMSLPDGLRGAAVAAILAEKLHGPSGGAGSSASVPVVTRSVPVGSSVGEGSVTVDAVNVPPAAKHPRRSAPLSVGSASMTMTIAVVPRKNFIKPSGLRPGDPRPAEPSSRHGMESPDGGDPSSEHCAGSVEPEAEEVSVVTPSVSVDPTVGENSGAVDVVTAPSDAKRARRSALLKLDLPTVKTAVAAAPRKVVVGRPAGAADCSTGGRVSVPPKRLLGAWRECELQVELAKIRKAASEGNRMTCPFCGEVSTKTSNMRTHAEDACLRREPVLKDWRYVCDGCPETFCRRDAYVRHIAEARCKKLKSKKMAKK